MAIIQELHLLSWKNFPDDPQTLGDLERFKLVIETMPDCQLIKALEKLRGKGRNDHPIQAVWNSILAGIVFEHISIQSLRRELCRNGQLRELCGFDPLLGIKAIPSKSAYARFIAKLALHAPLIRTMFDTLVKDLSQLFPNFAVNLAGDGKAIHSFGKPSKKKDGDQRRDEEADLGVKKYYGIDKEGKRWEKVKSWFGFRLHLIVDTESEMPVAYAVTKASLNEQPVMRKLIQDLHRAHPDLIDQCENMMLDAGYDSKETITLLWDQLNIKPIIDIRNMWRDGEKTRQMRTRNIQNVTYNYRGVVFCHCPKEGKIRQLCYAGFEKERKTLKYICPALHYGIHCQGKERCPLYKKNLRIPLKEDRRIFTPVARSSYKWKKLYKKRTSVERVNSRIDVSYGFEKHYIRGLTKMKLRCGLALSVMLAVGLGRLRQKRPELMRSLVKTAA